jgi:hypothetical protein
MNLANDLGWLMNSSINVNGEILFESKVVREMLEVTSSCMYKNKSKKEANFVQDNHFFITLRNLCGFISSCNKAVSDQFFGYIQHCLNRDFPSVKKVQDTEYRTNYKPPNFRCSNLPIFVTTQYCPVEENSVNIKGKMIVVK